MLCVYLGKDRYNLGKDLNGKELERGIYQRKDKRYEARIFLKGSSKPISLYGYNLWILKKERDLRIQELKSGLCSIESSLSVLKWFEQWMEIYNVPRLKATTIRNYINGFARVEDYIGYLKLRDVKPANIHFMIKQLRREGYSNVSIIHSLTIVNLLFRKAVSEHIIGANPSEGIKISSKDPNVSMKSFDEISKF